MLGKRGKQQEIWVVQAGLGQHEVPRVKDWKIVRKISVMNVTEGISGSYECPHLTTLLLNIRSYDI
ncbi:hypothetical protein F2Q70_00017071 [Brassica cretica]|uniref:Uncharacterized protein n=1 Tax=Brassica cretica TaxID=69181 RepID=A0A3N6R9N1_BRACR|nr:hypothetical protein F2Q70_00017071 [Brassica cretica]KAF2597647.1 hypothetical protein F2Q68_00010021 [Brassica cretica]KAF3537144.1 hypothetical protein F2Q69_00021958 [Brassica cretica]